MVDESTARLYGVDFFFKENELQESGDMGFTVALLVARNKANDGSRPYIEAVLTQKFKQGAG
jgi:ketosteroid isomerase-like protein